METIFKYSKRRQRSKEEEQFMKKHQKLKLIFMVVDSKDLLNGELIIL